MDLNDYSIVRVPKSSRPCDQCALTAPGDNCELVNQQLVSEAKCTTHSNDYNLVYKKSIKTILKNL